MAKKKGNNVRRVDAEHYIATHDAPIKLVRDHGALAMKPDPGSDFERETGGPGHVWRFWDFGKVIDTVNAIMEARRGDGNVKWSKDIKD
jgi:hypothetical protein